MPAPMFESDSRHGAQNGLVPRHAGEETREVSSTAPLPGARVGIDLVANLGLS